MPDDRYKDPDERTRSEEPHEDTEGDEYPREAADPDLSRSVGNPGQPSRTTSEALRDWSKPELLEHAERLNMEVSKDWDKETLVNELAGKGPGRGRTGLGPVTQDQPADVEAPTPGEDDERAHRYPKHDESTRHS